MWLFSNEKFHWKYENPSNKPSICPIRRMKAVSLLFALSLSLSLSLPSSSSSSSAPLSLLQVEIEKAILSELPLLDLLGGEGEGRRQSCLSSKEIVDCETCSVIGKYLTNVRQQVVDARNITPGGQLIVRTRSDGTFTKCKTKFTSDNQREETNAYAFVSSIL